jgi:hypothetical protein
MWYYTLNNQQVGPVDEKEIKKLIAAGSITHATMVWTTGMANWAPIGQSGLAPLMAAGGPPPVGTFPPMLVLEDPKVKEIKTLFMWFWISLIAVIIGIGAPAAGILFVIILYKSWKLVQHEGVRGTADDMVSRCFIPGWNFYWFFPAFRGLAKEFNDKFDRDNIPAEKINLDLPTWMIICAYGSGITVGLSAVAFVVLWIIYTVKIKNAAIAVLQAQK